MKKIFLITLLIIPFIGFSQNANKYQVNRAKMFSDYVAENMELTEEDKEFVNQVFLDRIVNAAKKIKGNGLSQEEKRECTLKNILMPKINLLIDLEKKWLIKF